MIIFLYGQDTYRLRQKLNEIIEHYKKSQKSGLSLEYFDFEKDDYENFRNEIQSASIFTEKKLLVLKNVFFNESLKANFLEDSKRFLDSKDIVLLYEEGEIPEKDKIFKLLKKSGKCQEFKPLEEKSLKIWAKKEFEDRNTKISHQALEKLINFVGNNLWQLSNEIQKLVTYKNKSEIKTSDIELLVKPKITTDIFKTIDAIAEKNKRKALSLIHQHLERGDSSLYLLSMINFQFRNLLIINSQTSNHQVFTNYPNTLAKKLGLHPYLVKKTLQQSKKFSLGDLKKIYQKIFQVDLAIKTGKLDSKIALDLLISEI